MKMGQGLDSLKAIVLGVITAAFLTTSTGIGKAVSFRIAPDPEISSEFTLVDTSLEHVNSNVAINFIEMGLADMESSALIPSSLQSSPLNNSQISPLTPPTLTFKPKRKNNAFFVTALTSTVLLQTADYVTTLNALKYSNLQEGNPLLKDVVKDPVVFGAFKLCITGLQIALLKKLYDCNKTLGWIVGTALNFTVSYIVANNLSKIQKAQLL